MYALGAERNSLPLSLPASIAPMVAIYTQDSGRADMVLDPNQIQHQMAYETAFHWLNVMLSEGIITQAEYDSEVLEIESKIKPIIMHTPLLYKE